MDFSIQFNSIHLFKNITITFIIIYRSIWGHDMLQTEKPTCAPKQAFESTKVGMQLYDIKYTSNISNENL